MSDFPFGLRVPERKKKPIFQGIQIPTSVTIPTGPAKPIEESMIPAGLRTVEPLRRPIEIPDPFTSNPELQQLTQDMLQIANDPQIVEELETAAYMSEMLQIPINDAYEMQRGIIEHPVTKKPLTRGDTLQYAKDMWANGIINNQLGQLWWQQMTGVGDQKAVETKIQELRDQQAELGLTKERRDEVGLFWRSFGAAAGIAPIMIKTLEAGALRGIAMGGAAGAMAITVGAAIPAPEEVITVPTAMFSMGMVGMVAGSADHIMRVEGGLAFGEMLAEGVDPDVARWASAGIGVINSAVELLQIGTFLKTIPGLRNLLTRGVKETTKKLLERGVIKALAKGAMAAGLHVAAEGAQEVVQESVTIAGTELSKWLVNEMRGKDLSHIQQQEVITRLWDTFKESMLGFGILMAPGTVAGITMRGMEAAKAKAAMGLEEAIAAEAEIPTEVPPIEEVVPVLEAEVPKAKPPIVPVEVVPKAPKPKVPEAEAIDARVEKETERFIGIRRVEETTGPPKELSEELGTTAFGDFAEVEEYYRQEDETERAGEVTPLSQLTGERAELARKVNTIKARIRTLTGQMKIGDFVREEDALKAVMKAERRVARGAFAAGKKQEGLRRATLAMVAREMQKQRKYRNKMIKDLKKVDTSEMSSANAEPINAMMAEMDLVKPTKKTIFQLERSRQYLEDNADAELPDYVLEDLKRLDKKNVRDVTIEELESIHDAIMQHVAIETKKQQIRVGKEDRRAETVLTDSIKEMKPAKEIVIETAFRPEEFAGVKKTGKLIKDTLGIRSDHYDLVVERLAGANSTMDKVLYQGIKEGTLKETKFIQDIFVKFQQDLKDAGLKIPNTDKWLEERRKVGGVDLSRNQRMAVLRHSLNPDNTTAITEGGTGTRIKKRNIVYDMPEKKFNQILKSITAEERKFAGIPVDNLFEATWQAMNRVFHEKYGYDMPRIKEGKYYPKDVMPIGRGKDFESEEALEKFKGKWTRVGLEKGMLEKRVGSKKAIYLNPMTYDINKAVLRAAAYVGLEIPLSNASKLLYNKDFKRELSNRYDEITWKEIEKGLRDVAGAREAYGTVEELLLKLRANLTTGTLGLNPFVPLKQPLSFVCYWPYVDMRHMMAGLADFAVHPKEVTNRHKLMSVEFKERLEGGFSRDITEVLGQKAERKLYGGKKGFKQRTMTGVQWFDIGAVGPGMQGAVLQVLDEFKDGHLSRQVKKALDMEDKNISKLTAEEKMQQAYKYADYATERSQPMFSALHRSSLSRGTPFEKLFTQYSSFTNQALNLIRRSWLDVRMSKSPAAMKTMGKVLFAVLVANAVGNVGIDRLRDWMYGREKKAALAQILKSWAGYFYFVRDVATSVESIVRMGSFMGYDVQVPVMRIPNLLARTIGEGMRMFTQARTIQKKKAALKFLDNGAELLFTSIGLPYSPTRNMIRGLTRRRR